MSTLSRMTVLCKQTAGYRWIHKLYISLSTHITQPVIITSDALPSAKSKANYIEYISAPPFTIFPIRTSFSSSVGFSRQVSSTQRIVHRHSFICSDVCSVTLATAMSSLVASIRLLVFLPRFLFPGSSIFSILLPICPSSFLRTWPNHLSLASLVFYPNCPTWAVPLMYSFLNLSILVTPRKS